MIINLDFEENCHSGTETGINKIEYDNIKSKNWLAYYDRSFY